MKRLLLVLGLTLAVSTPAVADMAKMRVGLDFAMPYNLTIDGSSTGNGRGAFNLGVDGRYMFTDNINAGMRVSFDLESKGLGRQIVLAPGMQYLWMPEETWNPFIRFDLPVLLQGALNTAGSSSKQDIGINAGAGIAWNMGEAIGVENLMLRYDFNFFYTFGLSSAVPVLGLEFFKIGFDYKF